MRETEPSPSNPDEFDILYKYLGRHLSEGLSLKKALLSIIEVNRELDMQDVQKALRVLGSETVLIARNIENIPGAVSTLPLPGSEEFAYPYYLTVAPNKDSARRLLNRIGSSWEDNQAKLAHTGIINPPDSIVRDYRKRAELVRKAPTN